MPIAPFVLAAFLAQAPGPAIAAVVEPRLESLRYRFENPSTFDTAELVPHFFEQRYDTDHLWLGARLRLRVRNIETEAGAGFTPQTTGRADDLDTFFNADGNTILSGTIGDASLRAWRADGRIVIGGSASLRYGIGYSYRRDTARYHAGTKIVRTSHPPAETRELVTTREFVASHIHQARWFARWKRERSWLAATLEASPFALGRLAIELPDKYPGRTLGFSARAALLAAEATAEKTIGSVALELGVRAERSFSYSSAARLRMQGVSFVLRAGTR